MNSTIKPSKCRECGSLYHSAMYHKPRKPIETKSVPKRSTKKIAQVGKEGLKWAETRRDWIKFNYAPGVTFTCHYCNTELSLEKLTLDHKTPRSRAPGLRYTLTNLVPCCFICNTLKGSRDHDKFEHNCPDTKKETV